jgi:hemin uptake protein HemP
MKSRDKINEPETPSVSNTATPHEQRRVLITDHQLNSSELFVGTREIAISHGDETYRLRLTSQNKLLLTK